jgi:hypothetical protein
VDRPWVLSLALRGLDPWVTSASRTAAAASRRPQPSSSFHAPPQALRFRTFATWRAVSHGFAAQTSAAAPATSGAENDVPLAQP